MGQGHKLTAFDIKTKDAHEQLELLNKDHLWKVKETNLNVICILNNSYIWSLRAP